MRPSSPVVNASRPQILSTEDPCQCGVQLLTLHQSNTKSTKRNLTTHFLGRVESYDFLSETPPSMVRSETPVTEKGPSAYILIDCGGRVCADRLSVLVPRFADNGIGLTLAR